jgi:hypothetical protein
MNDMTGQVLIIGDKVCDSRLHIFEKRRVSLREELLGRKDVIRRIKENQDIGYEQSGRA